MTAVIHKNFNSVYWHVEHANDDLYAANQAVFGSDGHAYYLNPDKGAGVVGDPATDPVSGDGTLIADWVRASGVDTRRNLTTPLAGIAKENSPTDAEIQGLVDANNWKDEAIIVMTPSGIDYVFYNRIDQTGSYVVRFDGVEPYSPIAPGTLNPATFHIGDIVSFDEPDGVLTVNSVGAWEPTSRDVAYRSGNGSAKFYFGTLAELQSTDLPVGVVGVTRGHLVEGDGGHGAYEIVATDPANSRSWALANGNFADLTPSANNYINRPEQFGAIGTDPDVNRETIRAMLDGHMNGVTCQFLAPDYLIQPDITDHESTAILPIKSQNITLESAESSWIRLSDQTNVNYDAVFGINVSSFVTEEINYWNVKVNIDQNAQGRPLTPAQCVERGRYAISIFRAPLASRNITVRGCRIVNTDSVVAIYLPDAAFATIQANGSYNANFTITNNLIESVINSGHTDYDQSHINAGAENLVISNNVIIGESLARASRTAIETHGSPLLVDHNIIRNYQIGMNITGIRNAGKTDVGMFCNDNLLEVTAAGIYLWSSKQDAAQTHTYGAGDITVKSNKILHRWSESENGQPRVVGIGLFAVSANPLPYGQITIEDCEMYYDAEDAANPALERTGATNYGALHFIGLSTAPYEIDNLKVRNVKIYGAPCAAVNMEWCEVKKGSITNCVFDDCGTLSTTINTQYRSVISLIPTMTGVGFELMDNTMYLGKALARVIYVRNRGASGSIIQEKNVAYGAGPTSESFVFSGTTVVDRSNVLTMNTGTTPIKPGDINVLGV